MTFVNAAGGRRAGPAISTVPSRGGPCEPMIPLFMYPAASHNWTGTALVASAVTLVTMLTLVLACEMGVGRLRLPWLEPYAHALAGATIAVCGVAITLFHL